MVPKNPGGTDVVETEGDGGTVLAAGEDGWTGAATGDGGAINASLAGRSRVLVAMGYAALVVGWLVLGAPLLPDNATAKLPMA